MLKCHESKDFGGGVIASLSIPWGFEKGDDDLGGYHLVWPRDLVETAGGFLAAGALDDARRVLHFLEVTQDIDGHWSQNMWLDGSPYWDGVQMDEAALPVLLVDLARRSGALKPAEYDHYWSMISAPSGIVRNGPVSPGSMKMRAAAVPRSARGSPPILVAAEYRGDGPPRIATSFGTADARNASLEGGWRDGHAAGNSVWSDGYYVRVAERMRPTPPRRRTAVAHQNRPPAKASRAIVTVSVDALALVRLAFGTGPTHREHRRSSTLLKVIRPRSVASLKRHG